MLTIKDVNQKIDDNYEDEGGNEGLVALVDEMWGDQNYQLTYEVKDLPTIKFIAAGGGEGDGAERWVVFSVAEQLFRMNGYYSSWGDGDWDGELEEVKAVQIMRTEYEEVK